MNNIYICALGAGNYKPAVYFKDDTFQSAETRYSQIATMMLWGCDKWNPKEGDKIIMLATEKAKNMCIKDHNDRDGNFVTGLKNEMIKTGIDWNLVTELSIKDGKNQEEIMEIFQLLYDELQEGANLYFDMTYGLRYLPMLMVVFNNYARFLKNTSCTHIAYGSFETPVDNRTPIIELDWLDFLQQWTTAAENFITSGNAEKLKKLTSNDKLRKNKKDITLDSQLSEYIEEYTSLFQSCIGREIILSNKFKKLKDLIDTSDFSNVPKQFVPILKAIEGSFNKFLPEENWKNGLYAAKWCYDHRLFQQALTFLQEVGFTYVCIQLSLDWGSIKERTKISNLVHYTHPYKKSKRKNLYGPEYSIYMEFIKDKECVNKWLDILNKCTEYRNQYNHAGMLMNPKIPEKLLPAIEKLINEALDIEDYEENRLERSEPKCPPLFINISNHPSSKWDENQLDAAQKYGKVVDIPFPIVEPQAQLEDIIKIADELAENVLCQVGDSTNSVVHVMGEMTLTYSLINIFRKLGIKCIASTTKRVVIENSDGSKISTFKFEQFREYE